MYAQIEGEFSLDLVGQMASLKYILSSPKHKSRMDGFLGFSGCFTIILGVLDLYKPSASSLVSNAQSFSGTRLE
jgi:hypothetical protein